MKIILLILTFFFALNLYAKEQSGFYEVPRIDGKIINYPSKIEFEGDSLAEASEFTVFFPKELVGVKNKFVIKKVSANKWSGDKYLFDEVNCISGHVFDFSCEFKFKKSSVIDQTNIELPMTTNSDPTRLVMNRDFAETALTMAAFSPAEISTHLISTDIFSSEPIGFLKYRENYAPINK